MKKIWLGGLLLAAMLLFCGCSKGESSDPSVPLTSAEPKSALRDKSENSEKEPKSSPDASDPVSKEEVVSLVREVAEKASEIYQMVYREGLQTDLEDEIVRKKGEMTRFYYRVIDPNYQKLEDVRALFSAIYSEKMVETFWNWVFEGELPVFADFDSGGLYHRSNDEYDNFEQQQNYVIPWLPETAEIAYQTPERMLVYVKWTNFSEEEEDGQMVFVREDGAWKLDRDILLESGMPYHGNFDMVFGDPMRRRMEILNFAQDPDNGYRLERSQDHYFWELDPDYYEFPKAGFEPYYGVNIYSQKDGRLFLEDKLFVGDQSDEIRFPERDERGVLTGDYVGAVLERSADSLIAYAVVPSRRGDDYELWTDFTGSMLEQGMLPVHFEDDDTACIVIPKYYGTEICLTKKVRDGKEKVLYRMKDHTLYIGKSDHFDYIVVIYGDQQLRFRPRFERGEQVPKADPIDYEFED